MTDAITGIGKLRCFFSHVSNLHKSRFPSKLALSKILLVLVGETTGGGFETLRGDKTQGFISRNKSLQLINTKA